MSCARRDNLSVADFIAEYEGPNVPVIITDVATKWPAMSKWTVESLSASHGHETFRCGAVDMVFNDFVSYLEGCKDDRCAPPPRVSLCFLFVISLPPYPFLRDRCEDVKCLCGTRPGVTPECLLRVQW